MNGDSKNPDVFIYLVIKIRNICFFLYLMGKTYIFSDRILKISY